jgi:hypothetical protein
VHRNRVAMLMVNLTLLIVSGVRAEGEAHSAGNGTYLGQVPGLEYAPYWSRGLFRRAWPDYLEPIQVHWTRYLRGEAGAEEAVRGVVSAIIR